MGIGVGYHMMDSNKSLNTVNKMRQRQLAKTEDSVEVTSGLGDSKAEVEYSKEEKVEGVKVKTSKEKIEEILTEVNEQAKEAISEVQKAITKDDTETSETEKKEDDDGSIFDWWWTVVGAYFLFKLFLGD